ncbi:hypothetical protein ACKI2N_027400 [Cupriavidus sp. 30B13]|uniref:hypothetical protein n=1 Tax=Cupriavidus sp. 30B13 TaxID=3384241 RepID=UPI003B8EB1CE
MSTEPTSSTPGREAIQRACNAVLDAFMQALNDHDAAAMDRCMHFPHTRLANGATTLYQAPGSNPMDLFKRLEEADGWSYSRWESREVVQFNAHKAHVLLSYTRFRKDDSVIGVYDSMYVMTLEADGWGIQARSSFGP